MKSLANLVFILFLALAPLSTHAAVVGGVSGNGGFLGVSGGGTTFGISWGNGGGFGGLACSSSICGIAQTLILIINTVLVPLLFAISFIVFLYGVYKTYIYSHGEASEVAAGHRLVLWGIIGFAVMLSLWGLVNVVATTFGLGGYSAPTPPTSY